MRSATAAYCLLAALIGPASAAAAADCPGNPGALGVSRTIAVDPTEHPLLGAHNYRESLPLNDHEIVLTFDDGPLPPYTSRVLDTLAAECVKATFFMVGRMAQGYPHLVQRAHAEGHTLGTHSQNHPFTFHKMLVEDAAREIEDGFTSVRTALADPKGVSDFFRVPGLLRQDSVEQYLTAHGYMTWSVDFMADDWRHIGAREIIRRAVNRIEAHRRGILLLHDIQPATALALPQLLRELKNRGYKIVHVVQAGPERPKTATLPEQWVVRSEQPSIWPHVALVDLPLPGPVLEVPNRQIFASATARVKMVPVALSTTAERPRSGEEDPPSPAVALWPRGVKVVSLSDPEALPVPAAENFRYSRVWRVRSAERAVHKPPAKKHVVAAASRRDGLSMSRGADGLAPPARTSTPNSNLPATFRQRPSGHQIQLPKPTAGLYGLP